MTLHHGTQQCVRLPVQNDDETNKQTRLTDKKISKITIKRRDLQTNKSGTVLLSVLRTVEEINDETSTTSWYREELIVVFWITSSGARAMCGFGAMCLLRRSRCMFLAPQSAAFRCPWIRALLVPVVRVPSCARGPPCVFFYCTCTTNMYNCTVL